MEKSILLLIKNYHFTSTVNIWVELSIRSFVVVVKFAWVERIGPCKRIINLNLLRFTGVEPILSLSATLKTFDAILPVEDKGSYKPLLSHVKFITI
jgi:hypothetical protein